MDGPRRRRLPRRRRGDLRRLGEGQVRADHGEQRFTALQSGEVDILSRNTTWTLQRDTALGLDFTGVNYYDGQGFMVTKKLGVKSAKELNGATVCVQPGTTTELNLADYFRANKMTFKPVVIEKVEEIRAAFYAGRCDVYTTDASGLYSTRAANAPRRPSPTTTSSCRRSSPRSRSARPCAMATTSWPTSCAGRSTPCSRPRSTASPRRTSTRWLKSENPDIKRILGVTPGMGKALGVDEKWVYKIVKQVGNYGESFERNVGMGSPLKIDRGLNALWTKGGLQYAPPIR